MECSLAALIACFSWSNLYIDAQISYQDRAVPYHYWKDVSPPPRDGLIETAYVSTIGDENESPYVRPAIGLKLEFRSIDVSVDAFYSTSTSSKYDRGVKGIALRAQWFPFRN